MDSGKKKYLMENKKINTLRRINSKRVTETVKKLFIEANTCLQADVVSSLHKALKNEESPIGKQVLKKILENARIARTNAMQ